MRRDPREIEEQLPLLDTEVDRQSLVGQPTRLGGPYLVATPIRLASDSVTARWLPVYCTQMGPICPPMLRQRSGNAADVDALLAAKADRDVPVLPASAVLVGWTMVVRLRGVALDGVTELVVKLEWLNPITRAG